MGYHMIFAVAAGGAAGAVARYLVMSSVGHWLGHGFPWGTIAVNIIGSLVLGALIEVMALVWSPTEAMRAFLVVGVLGAFTTFSAFSMDTVYLFERGEIISAAFYVAASVFICVLALWGGMTLFRQILV